MDTVWLVEHAGMAVRAFATRARAEQYLQCMLEEEYCPGEPMYAAWELEIVSMEIEK